MQSLSSSDVNQGKPSVGKAKRELANCVGKKSTSLPLWPALYTRFVSPKIVPGRHVTEGRPCGALFVTIHASATVSSLMTSFVLCHNRFFSLAQNVLHSACGVSTNIFWFDCTVTSVQSYVRATRYILPSIFNALSKGNDPDRIKGALYVLGNKGTGMWLYCVFRHDLI